MTTQTTRPIRFAKLFERARTHFIPNTEPPRGFGVMSKALGVSRQTIYNLLEGRHTPRPFIRARLAKGLAKLLAKPVVDVRQQLEADWRETL